MVNLASIQFLGQQRVSPDAPRDLAGKTMHAMHYRNASASSWARADSHRYTLDGDERLERHLESTCDHISREVRALLPDSKLEGLLLAGGYGRGEGGVLRTDFGDQPYNDLEFYVFMRGNCWLNERRYSQALQALGKQVSPLAKVDVEFKLLSRDKLRRARPSMFYYDLLAGHRRCLGEQTLLAGCEHHGDPTRIPVHEATRLLLNRCSGLLFSAEHLCRPAFGRHASDFVGRNLAKAQLGLGDALLAASNQYHWNCRERHRRLAQLRLPGLAQYHETLHRHHGEGVAFKLHPIRSRLSREALATQHLELSLLAQRVWLWLESQRLGIRFSTTQQYALSTGDKCPETLALRNRLVNARNFGPLRALSLSGSRYPRERLLRALPLLLWERHVLADEWLLAAVQRELSTNTTLFSGLVEAYEKLWHRFQ